MSDPRPSKPRPSHARRIVFLTVVAAAIAGYAVFGLLRDDLVLPYPNAGHSGIARPPSVHFHGIWAWAMAAALGCVALAALLAAFEYLRKPAGAKASQALVTGLSGVGFVVGIVLVELAHFGVI